MEDLLKTIKETFKGLKVHHYIVFALVLAIGGFNAFTALYPKIQQRQRESNIEKIFNKWWEEEGAAQVESVGLKADETIRNEKLGEFRDRYLKENGNSDVEARVEAMRKEFREWWEIKGGKEEFIKEHNYYPKENDFAREQEKWVKAYTDKHLRYRLAFVPAEEEYDRLLTCWILFPGILSFLIFAGFFCFAYVQLSKRWGIAIVAGIAVGLFIAGGVLVALCTGTSFFDHYAVDRYMGASIALCFLLGAAAFGPKKDSASFAAKVAAFAGLILDVVVNWVLNGGIYGAVGLVSLVAFGLGVVAGQKIPQRLKTVKEVQADQLAQRLKKNAGANLFAERKAHNRALIDKGLEEAQKAHYESAQRLLSQALTAMLQEHPIDAPAVKKLADQMTSPSVFIEVPSAQWLEWGEVAKSKNSMDSALVLLEKGLFMETNPTLARRALYNIGEIRVVRNWDMEQGIARLKKVLELGDGDILAVQARSLLKRAEDKLEREKEEAEQVVDNSPGAPSQSDS